MRIRKSIEKSLTKFPHLIRYEGNQTESDYKLSDLTCSD